MFVTGTSWNRHKGTPKPDIIQKTADFIPSDPELTPDTPKTISASKKSEETEGEMLRFIRLVTSTVIRFMNSVYKPRQYELLVNKLKI